ncbi:ParB/RepB/Spo0J family partition protein [Basilea psittacipulmonis]|nr:ParB/RepB/Spo0J family partition protein [Basilea psittacipulmonis]
MTNKTTSNVSRRGLGGGAKNLLVPTDIDSLLDEVKNTSKDSVMYIKLSDLQPGHYQPRTFMDDTLLNELADSIREQGVIQPLLVRKLKDNRYEIIAGERRFRAAKIAGLLEVPALVKSVDDQNAAIIALIENMQRADLNALEEAKGVKRLIDEFSFTHEQASKAIGRSRSFTTNLLRLLNLAEPVQKMLSDGQLDMGHARALLATDLGTQIILANQVINKNLSVRETEKLVATSSQKIRPKSKKDKNVDADVLMVQRALSDYLQTKVNIKLVGKKKGSLVFDFSDWDHLNDLLDKLGLNEYLASL